MAARDVAPITFSASVDGAIVRFDGLRWREWRAATARLKAIAIAVCLVGRRWPLKDSGEAITLIRVTDLTPYLAGQQELMERFRDER